MIFKFLTFLIYFDHWMQRRSLNVTLFETFKLVFLETIFSAVAITLIKGRWLVTRLWIIDGSLSSIIQSSVIVLTFISLLSLGQCSLRYCIYHYCGIRHLFWRFNKKGERWNCIKWISKKIFGGLKDCKWNVVYYKRLGKASQHISFYLHQLNWS